MSGMTTSNTDVLIRSEIWSNQLKEVLKDNLEATKYVNWIDFPDGTTLTIPSIGEMDTYDYTEDTAIEYTPMALGEFQFTINEYLASATYITAKARQDSYYAAQLEARFLPEQERAIMVAIEGHVLQTGQPGLDTNSSATQTSAALNNINGAPHRFVGSDTVGGQQTLGIADFAKARYSLKKANVPDTNLIAIVDPSFEYHFNTQAGFLDVTYNPMWEGIVAQGVASGMRFMRNIYGFDVYVSNYLPTGFSETIDSVASGAGATAALFFSTAAGDIKPWVGAYRQPVKVDGEWNKDFQREEYVTTCRYDTAFYRPENLVTVLGQVDIV